MDDIAMTSNHEELRTLLDLAQSMATDCMRECGEVASMVLCAKGDEETFIIAYDPAPTAMQRRFQALLMGNKMREMGVVRYVVAHECWMVDRPIGHAPDIPPSQCDDREEIVLLEGFDLDEERCRMFHIDRAGEHVSLVAVPLDEKLGLSGTWSGLLNDPDRAN